MESAEHAGEFYADRRKDEALGGFGVAGPPYGAQSRAYLQSGLRIGSVVTLLPQAVDRHGRTVAEVIDDINLNLAMEEDGQVFAYRKYLRQCDSRENLDA
ncbi:MAG: thermonuclease family protein [Prochlorococcaceae cyanobacterium]